MKDSKAIGFESRIYMARTLTLSLSLSLFLCIYIYIFSCSSYVSLDTLSNFSDPPCYHLHKDNNGRPYFKEIFCET